MTPDRTGQGRGHFRIDRIIAGVGRVRLSSGTSSKAVFKRRDALLTALAQRGALDTIRALVAREVTWPELEYAGRTGRDLLADVRARRPLQATVDALQATVTADRYRVAWAKLARLGHVGPHTTAGDLEALPWAAIAEGWPGTAGDWMATRRTVSRLLTLALGDKYHPVRRAVVAAMPAKKVRPRVVRATAATVAHLLAQLEPRAARIAWTILLLGLRRAEYWRTAGRRGAWQPDTRTLEVAGEKTDDSYAVIGVADTVAPYVAAAIPAPLSLSQFRRYFEPIAQPLGLTIHSLRNLHAMLATEAGVPEAMVRLSMRHGSRSITDDYRLGLATRTVQQAILDAVTVAGMSGEKSGDRPASTRRRA
jgi:hypothetical protein